MKRLAICVLVSCLGFYLQASGQNVITTVAGNGSPSFSGDGGPTTSSSLNLPFDVAVDTSGNFFIAGAGNNRIRKVSASGVITTLAGNGPSCINLKPWGGFAADSDNNRVFRVSPAGSIRIVAGNGTQTFSGGGFSGDGGPATSASLNSPTGIAVDAAGNLFIADTFSNRIRKVSASGIITTVAGSGAVYPTPGGFSGDGGPATSASLSWPVGVAVDASGNLFIADAGNNRIRKVSASGIITTLAGNGRRGFSGDGGPATSAPLSHPFGVAVDASGNLFIADLETDRIRKVSASGIITTVAGSVRGFSGDGAPATLGPTQVYLDHPSGVAVSASGNLFIADTYNNRIRKVPLGSGPVTTVAGNGTRGFSGDGGPAPLAPLVNPMGVAVDAARNLFIADTFSNRIRKVSAGGIITTVAGNGSNGFFGDGGPATSAALNNPKSVAVDASGNLFIADSQNNLIRKVSASGIITTVAGNGPGARELP